MIDVAERIGVSPLPVCEWDAIFLAMRRVSMGCLHGNGNGCGAEMPQVGFASVNFGLTIRFH